MAYSNPAVADFKTQFARDFPYGIDPNAAVLDSDIISAFLFTNTGINPDLFADQPSYTLCYLLLSAHYLVMNLRSSAQGLNGAFSFLEQSKSVGSISQSFAIPQRILDNPDWAILAKTNYGAQYLAFVLPQLAGQVYTVLGSTLA